MSETSPEDNLEWIRQVRDGLYTNVPETFLEKAKRKTKENPLVPIGTLATISALSYGLYSFSKGDRVMSQYMMRARVGAQAFTICCMVGGYIIAVRKQEK
ncbi:HIG1 domain family member 2A, mitochondrial [Nomia melanderi]|uniref:HIG1 domain family member 2A, mitochondrial n=1 Tax=Nomia melanderi TaxID=2448451 RepID=UPI00130470D2|nr:HIG1 domain family member 2A, mitochondrial [Nomia melanderi]XP_031842486.1 HIG1 domain family member 2A, mitochondrial [Nomia melanderi]XP_031842487.1 HIG1 domain family member 2A, mitochondrial [Nomia melanderi]